MSSSPALPQHFFAFHQLTTITMQTDTPSHPPGRSSREDSPASGEDEIVEPEQGNGKFAGNTPPLRLQD